MFVHAVSGVMMGTRRFLARTIGRAGSMDAAAQCSRGPSAWRVLPVSPGFALFNAEKSLH